MISRRAAALSFALPLALLLSPGTAPAQEGASSVAKTPPAPKPTPAPAPHGLTEPEGTSAPPTGEQTGATGAPPPSPEMVPPTVAEGAGWEAAAEEAEAATPPIGGAAAKAPERI